MNLHRKIPMEFESIKYEIRVLYDREKISALPFYRNRPFCCFRHQIFLPKGINAEKLLDTDAVTALIAIAKEDITSQRGLYLNELFGGVKKPVNSLNY